jgi:CrcB protein
VAHLAPDDEDRLGPDPEVEPATDARSVPHPTAAHAAAVLAGGMLGTLGRDLLLRAAPARGLAVPWMLIGLNLVGAALLGVVVARVLDPRPERVELRLFVATGLLGGFTTYSSLVSAAIVRGHNDALGTAFLTLLGTAAVGVAAAWLGTLLRPRTTR